MNIYAVILARGGSKGVPRKNVLPLNGKPLIAWTIEAAKKVPTISRVVVNTDDDEIASVAESYGAEIYMRPSELAGDDTPDLPVFEQYLTRLKAQGELPDMIVDLRPTAPLRSAKRIAEGIELLSRIGILKADSVRAVSKAAKHPYKMWNLKGEHITPFLSKSVTGLNEPYNAPRQVLPQVYQNNGCMNAFWPATVLEKHSMSGNTIAGFVMDDWESVNIDTKLDFKLAELLMKEHEKLFA